MSVCKEKELVNVSFNAEKNEMTSTSFKKIFHVNRTPTPIKPVRHWCMSTELLRSQYQTNHKPKIYNPFNENLMQRLGETTLSPNFFTNAVSPGQENEFEWNIDDVSKLNPAKIDDECVVDEDQVDDETESKLQETINKYFYNTHKIPSPWNNQVIDWERRDESTSPSTPMSIKKKSRFYNYREVSTQTDLSFPMVLPDHVEEVLKPYFMNSTQTQTNEETSPTKDTSTLRRKLFFLNDNDDPISPVKVRKVLPVSPLTRCLSNSLSSKGPVIGNHLGIQELPKDCHVPIDVSPIVNTREMENTPPKDKSRDFAFTTPVSTLSMPKRRRRTNKSNTMMENSSDTGYQTMSMRDTSSMISFGHETKNILFTASTPTER